jgi:hypothetical protein
MIQVALRARRHTLHQPKMLALEGPKLRRDLQRHGGRLAKTLSTCPRRTWRRISTSPVALMPCT